LLWEEDEDCPLPESCVPDCCAIAERASIPPNANTAAAPSFTEHPCVNSAATVFVASRFILF
jgi:hypothetical protein